MALLLPLLTLLVCTAYANGFLQLTSGLSSARRADDALQMMLTPQQASTLVTAAGDLGQPEFNLAVYYIAGGLCASLSHCLAIPIDVVKTRQQTDSDLKTLGPWKAMKTIIGKDGVPSLLKGAGPTMVGYALQGSLKYGIYEFLKPIVAASIIASTDTSSIRSTILDLLISGALAETVGSSVLTPFEAARIRLVSYPDYGDGGGVGSCLYRMVREGGFRSLFLGYPAIVAKQIPYTAASLCTFEIASKYIYSQVLGVGTAIVTNPTIGSAVAQGVIGGEINTSYGDATVITSIATAIVTMESIPSLTRFEVTFTAASAAALIGAVVSQPGDTLLSVINNKTRIITMENKAGLQEGEGASSSPVSPVNMEEEGFSPAALMVETARELGVRGLYTGFKARLLHVMTIVVSQLLIYDYTKQVVGSIIH